MPTGYTHRVQSGEITTLRDFAMTCARAFGACITMRDDSLNAPIPEKFEPSDYHEKKIEEAMDMLDWLNKLTPTEREHKAQAEYEKGVKQDKEYLEKNTLEYSRYVKMLSQVRQWQAPDEMVNLKNFMIEQLNSSMEFDCNIHYQKRNQQTGNEWFAEMLKNIQYDIDYHQKEHMKEVKRTEERNRWIATLRESLPPDDKKQG